MKLIDKDALVAEIERRVTEGEEVAKEFPSSAIMGLIQAYKNTLSYIDTLEVEEVDMDKTFNDEYSKFSNDTDAMDYAFPIDIADFKDFAKHFFELGLRAQKGE